MSDHPPTTGFGFQRIYWPLFWRWPARIRCHGTTRACQYIDHPMCNPPGGDGGGDDGTR